jgi:hypothetical protein
VALLEPVDRQPQQVGEDVHQPLQVQGRRQYEHRHERAAAVAAWMSTSRPKPSASVSSRSRSPLTTTPSTDPLHEERAQSRNASSASAEHEDLAERALQPRHRPEQLRSVTRWRSTTRREAGRRLQLERRRR